MIAREHNVVVIPASEPESRGGDAELNSDPSLPKLVTTPALCQGLRRRALPACLGRPSHRTSTAAADAVRVAAPSTARLSWSLTGSSDGPPGVLSTDDRGSGWVPVGFADFKSVGPGPSVGVVGSTPSRSRQDSRLLDIVYGVVHRLRTFPYTIRARTSSHIPYTSRASICAARWPVPLPQPDGGPVPLWYDAPWPPCTGWAPTQ